MTKKSTTLLFLLVLAVFAGTTRGGNVQEGKPGPGDAIPAFSVNDLNGKKTSSEEILKEGKVILLNFWGLRCSNCIEEIGYLNPLYEKYRDKGVAFLGVNVDGAAPDTIRKLMPNMPNVPRFTVLPDPEFKIPDLFNMMGAPLSLVIGRDGKVVYRHEDFKPGDEKGIEAALKTALAAAK